MPALLTWKDMSMKCIIVGAGEFSGLTDEYGDEIVIGGDDLLIGADGGYDALINMNLTPDIVVGDFDSREGKVPDVSGKTELVELKVQKNDTDLGHAVELGFERGYKDFLLFGASGGRLSHTEANIRIMRGIVERGGSAVLYGKDSVLRVFKDSRIDYSEKNRGMLSLFSLTEVSEGVTIRGLEYPLTDYTMSYTDPIGVSNMFTGEKGYIEVRKGVLLAINEFREREAGL
jgi:thiamine pyrophosphokinase